jgi:hypothetical protein
VGTRKRRRTEKGKYFHKKRGKQLIPIPKNPSISNVQNSKTHHNLFFNHIPFIFHPASFSLILEVRV